MKTLKGSEKQVAAAEAMQKASGRLNQTVINKMMEGFDLWGTI